MRSIFVTVLALFVLSAGSSALASQQAKPQPQGQQQGQPQKPTTPAQPGEVTPEQIFALFNANKFDEGFAEGAKYIENHPDDVQVRTQLAIVASSQAQRGDAKYVAQGKQYASQAIQAIEADKKSLEFDDTTWPTFKTQWLPKLYQGNGVLAYVTSDKAAARQNIEKAAGLDPGDPVNPMLLGTFANDEYQELAKKFNADKNEAVLKQAMAKMDEVIDWYARSVAAADGKPGYEALQKEITAQLEQYYSFRHNNSTTGLKELIEKYKKK